MGPLPVNVSRPGGDASGQVPGRAGQQPAPGRLARIRAAITRWWHEWIVADEQTSYLLDLWDREARYGQDTLRDAFGNPAAPTVQKPVRILPHMDETVSTDIRHTESHSGT
jgi:hypothetical protein